MTEPRYRLPNEVANQLQISPSTLRRWSNEFADYLSDAAGRPEMGPRGRVAHRRYTDQDLETLLTIKGLLNEGLTYVQVARRLEALRVRQAPAEEAVVEEGGETTALGPSLRDESPFASAAVVLSDTIHTVAEGQQLILGSQQANREMMTVLLQDNFTLKEENAKLRDRMLELERDMAEMRRQEAARREALEARLRQIEEQVQRPPAPARPTSPRRKSQPSGCLGQFFS